MTNSDELLLSLLYCEMKKLTKEYLNAVGQHALNAHKTELMLSSKSVGEKEINYVYEENEYIVGFKLLAINDDEEWVFVYIIPSPTEYELNEMDKIASRRKQVFDNETDNFKVRFQYEDNVFEVEYSKNSDGEFERGYFMPYISQ